MFITLEGPDGSGKSTQAVRLVEHLTERGYRVLATREPGGTPIGQQIRTILMAHENTAMRRETEFLLFSASRAQLVREVIQPHLAAGGVVVCDRFFDSSLAYQGYGHGLPLEMIRQITHFATDGLSPDLTLLFDIDPEAGLRRRQIGNADWNRLDDMALAFHQRVQAGFQALVAAEPQRWVTINADQPPDAVTAEMLQAVSARLPQSGRR